MSVSVVVPIYNEVENLPHLHAGLTEVLSQLPARMKLFSWMMARTMVRRN